MPSAQKMSLTAIGTPASAPSLPRPILSPPQIGIQLIAAKPPARQRSTPQRRALPRNFLRRLRDAQFRGVSAIRLRPEARELETPHRPDRGLRQHNVPGPARSRLVWPQHVLKLDYVRSGRHAAEIKRRDPIDVLQDPGKLAGHPLDLSLLKAQPGQLRDVRTCSRSITGRTLGGSPSPRVRAGAKRPRPLGDPPAVNAGAEQGLLPNSTSPWPTSQLECRAQCGTAGREIRRLSA